jgi:uncharacterized membrane protein (UPF0182 family)
VVGGIVFLLLLSAGAVVRFYTDLLWFREVRLGSVYWRILWSRLGLGTAGGLLAAAFVYVNLEVARRAAPRSRFVTPAGDVAERYRSGDLDAMDAIRRYGVILDWGTSELLPRTTEQFRAMLRRRAAAYWHESPEERSG